VREILDEPITPDPGQKETNMALRSDTGVP
jgi:hypothetical protein